MRTHSTLTEAITSEVIEPLQADFATQDIRTKFDIDAIADKVIGHYSTGYALRVTPEQFWRIVKLHTKPQAQAQAQAQDQEQTQTQAQPLPTHRHKAPPPSHTASRHHLRYLLGDYPTIEEAMEAAITADRNARDIYEVLAELLDERASAHRAAGRTQDCLNADAAAERLREVIDASVWDEYIEPLLDTLEANLAP